MIKELLLAIVLGSLLGFGFTGGYLAIKKNQNTPSNIATTTPSPTSTSTNADPKLNVTPTNVIDTNTDAPDHKLTIDTPENEALVSSSSVNIKGSTSPQSSIVINTPIKSYFTTADNAGNFSINIEIDSGPNMINISSFDTQDNDATTKLLITYSTAKI